MFQLFRSSRGAVAGILLLWIANLPVDEASGLHETSDPRIVEHPDDLYVGRNEPATLTCRAEGHPAPVFAWYRDGQPVTTVNDDPNVHRMLLPTGDLFFLRVARGKAGGVDSDIGVYYCNATNPETKVSVVSRNASLKIAVMKDEFRQEPRSTEVGVGMDAVLDCKPPRGEPEPRVRWLKGDLVVQPGERVSVDDQGSLRIQEVRKEDAGPYVCMAYNVGGEKESAPAQLFVREKPAIVEVPKDTVAQENSDVILQCQASGDPEPDIIWKKLEGQIPAERIQILADKSLKIHNVQVADEGIYVCRLDNPFGWQEAQAVLTVHSPPSFTVTPRDKVVGVGKRVSIRCEVTGNPTPAVFWNKASSQTFMFPNKDHGRFRVTADGSLTIDNVQKEDAGEYTCQGLSMAGSAYAKARVEVKDGDTRPPPIIHQGPQNQTLPVGGAATLSCLATGEPEPSIFWLKNGVILSPRDTRINVRGSGSLEISELSRADTGLYTCKAVSETGETAWSAALAVESTDNPFIVFHRTPEPSTFPGSPLRPVVGDVTETTVRLTWKPNANHGASPVISFSVEYFSHDTGEGWTMASDEISDQSYVVRNLQPNTSYLFLVRARNSHGLSLPSPVTSVVRTKGNSLPHPRPTIFFDPSLVAEKLSGQVIHVLPAEVLSSTTIKLNWELRKNVMRFVEGFHVKYRVVPDLGRPDSNPDRADYTIRTVQTPSVTTHVLSGLQKYMWYEVLMLPYYGTVEGPESNTVQFRTLEDVPSAAPKNIHASILENDTLVVTWEPPQKQFRNGVLRGYHIYIQGNESKFDKIVDVNVSIETVHVRNLVKDMHYHLQMAAYNRMGEGVKSELIRLRRPGSETGEPLYDQQWFRIALIVTFGVVLWIVFCVLSVCIYRKRRAHLNNAKKKGIQKEEEFRSLQKSDEIVSHLPLLVDKKKEASVSPSVVGQPCMATCFHDNESPSDGDSKTNGSVFCGHTYQTLETVQNFDNHCHCSYDAAMQCGSIGGSQCTASLALPYATATLVCGAPNRIYPGPGNIPNPKAYMIHQPYGCPKHASSINTSKTESPNSTFGGSDGLAPASGLGPLSQSDLCHPTCCADHHRKCSHLPLYNSVMYDQHDRIICGHEDCQRRAESHRLLCNSAYAGGMEQSRCFTPDSVLTDSDVRDCSQTPWPSTTDNDSDSNCSCASSCGADAESFMVSTDFVSAVNKAAEQSGLSVVGSTISPVTPDGRKVRRLHRTRHRENRPKSPYSTDSNASAMSPKQKPASKSDQTKIAFEQQSTVLAGGIPQLDSRTSSQADDIPLKKPTAPFSLTGSARAKMSANDLAFSSNPVIGNFHHPTLANTSSILNCQTNVV